MIVCMKMIRPARSYKDITKTLVFNVLIGVC